MARHCFNEPSVAAVWGAGLHTVACNEKGMDARKSVFMDNERQPPCSVRGEKKSGLGPTHKVAPLGVGFFSEKTNLLRNKHFRLRIFSENISAFLKE